MKGNFRVRQWSLITYASPEQFKSLLDTALHWAWILHDKDDNENHCHIILVFKNARSFDGLKRLIDSDQNTFGEPVKTSLSSMYDYLLHENQSDKVQYSPDDIVCDDSDYWLSLNGEQENICDSLIDDILSGFPLRVLARKYGRDFMRNYKDYIHFADLVYSQEHGKMQPYQLAAEIRVKDKDFDKTIQDDNDDKIQFEQLSFDSIPHNQSSDTLK